MGETILPKLAADFTPRLRISTNLASFSSRPKNTDIGWKVYRKIIYKKTTV